jgi:hypothetical protein
LKKKNYILKEAGILLIIGVLISSMAASADMMIEQDNDSRINHRLGNPAINYHFSQHISLNNPFGSIFLQLPYLSNATPYEWGAPFSDSKINGGYLAFDDFHNITSPICDIHWWGLTGISGSEPGNPQGMRFNITFYEYDNFPSTVVCSYTNVSPTIIPTGITYYYELTNNTWKLYYFTDVDLDPCCTLTEGWVSIQSISYEEIGVAFGWEPSPDGNDFGWQYFVEDKMWFRQGDYSLVLTDGEPSDPDLECEGSLSWDKVEPGDNVTGSFKVRNNGDAGSILNWNVSNYPMNWGTNWTFTPKASVLSTDMGWITVNVNVTAPKERRKEFTGKLIVVNAVDPSDNCEIDVVLKTPKNKAFIFNFPSLNWLFEKLPDSFPILRYMLGI